MAFLTDEFHVEVGVEDSAGAGGAGDLGVHDDDGFGAAVVDVVEVDRADGGGGGGVEFGDDAFEASGEGDVVGLGEVTGGQAEDAVACGLEVAVVVAE